MTMRVLVDTNVLLAALPKLSRYRPIVNAIATGHIELVVSTAILLEYQEILTQKTNSTVATNFLEFLTKMPHVIRVGTPFTWGLVTEDFDDNKFVDAGLIAGADYIITYDTDFNVVKENAFPRIGVVNADEFLALLEENS
ncbi:putative toxin-antitoxin system toxin component, PIN family [Fibrella aquatilis]|uniref:Toxin-antitoxin system toxin component, PIN family n=1 Tax=Fibrella aquatilis TaxID=2817059 RepID=A0A939G2D8_9BACT|nr:putative toxin-antitoxin system toxin component, PIN family [Fibrella aquatilis]MBO0929825.1 putative toxin-antitoxin system toxin component, PIN family [Fibrella aquatilis]